MDEKEYIHQLVLKVFDELKDSIEHYQLYKDVQMYITVFFHTEEERNDAFADGVCNQIDRKFLELAKPYDKENILNSNRKYIYYDSMENLNKNYQGKMPVYFAE